MALARWFGLIVGTSVGQQQVTTGSASQQCSQRGKPSACRSNFEWHIRGLAMDGSRESYLSYLPTFQALSSADECGQGLWCVEEGGICALQRTADPDGGFRPIPLANGSRCTIGSIAGGQPEGICWSQRCIAESQLPAMDFWKGWDREGVAQSAPIAIKAASSANAILRKAFYQSFWDVFQAPGNGQSLIFSLVGLPDSSGLEIDSAFAVLHGSPAVALIGTNVITILATTVQGLSASHLFTLTVYENNDSPFVKSPLPSLKVQEGASVVARWTDYFGDPDGDALVFRVAGLPQGGGLVMTNDGVLRGVPGMVDVISSLRAELRDRASNETAGPGMQIQVTADDGKGGTVTQPVAITVSPKNKGVVVVVFPSEETTQVGQQLLVDLAKCFFDPDQALYEPLVGVNVLYELEPALPPGSGLKLNPTVGTLSGVPTQVDLSLPQPMRLTISASDAAQRGLQQALGGGLKLPVANVTFSLTILAAAFSELPDSSSGGGIPVSIEHSFPVESTREENEAQNSSLWPSNPSASSQPTKLELLAPVPPQSLLMRRSFAMDLSAFFRFQSSDEDVLRFALSPDPENQGAVVPGLSIDPKTGVVSGAASPYSVGPGTWRRMYSMRVIAVAAREPEVRASASMVVTVIRPSRKSCGQLSWPMPLPRRGGMVWTLHNDVCASSTVLPASDRPPASERPSVDQEEIECAEKVSFATAVESCRRIGSRICSDQELISDVAKDTGCLLDSKRVWSGTLCGERKVLTVAGSSAWQMLEQPRCSEEVGRSTRGNVGEVSDGLHFRCCADQIPDSSDSGLADLEDGPNSNAMSEVLQAKLSISYARATLGLPFVFDSGLLFHRVYPTASPLYFVSGLPSDVGLRFSPQEGVLYGFPVLPVDVDFGEAALPYSFKMTIFAEEAFGDLVANTTLEISFVDGGFTKSANWWQAMGESLTSSDLFPASCVFDRPCSLDLKPSLLRGALESQEVDSVVYGFLGPLAVQQTLSDLGISVNSMSGVLNMGSSGHAGSAEAAEISRIIEHRRRLLELPMPLRIDVAAVTKRGSIYVGRQLLTLSLPSVSTCKLLGWEEGGPGVLAQAENNESNLPPAKSNTKTQADRGGKKKKKKNKKKKNKIKKKKKESVKKAKGKPSKVAGFSVPAFEESKEPSDVAVSSCSSGLVALSSNQVLTSYRSSDSSMPQLKCSPFPVTFAQARTTCREMGARMCSRGELLVAAFDDNLSARGAREEQVCMRTGVPFWSSTICDLEAPAESSQSLGAVVVLGSSVSHQCVNFSARRHVYCCADRETERSQITRPSTLLLFSESLLASVLPTFFQPQEVIFEGVFFVLPVLPMFSHPLLPLSDVVGAASTNALEAGGVIEIFGLQRSWGLFFDAASGTIRGVPGHSASQASPIRITLTFSIHVDGDEARHPQLSNAEKYRKMVLLLHILPLPPNKSPIILEGCGALPSVEGDFVLTRYARLGEEIRVPLAPCFFDADEDPLVFLTGPTLYSQSSPSFSIEPSSGVFSGVPSIREALAAQPVCFHVLVADGKGGSVGLQLKLYVEASPNGDSSEVVEDLGTVWQGVPLLIRLAPYFSIPQTVLDDADSPQEVLGQFRVMEGLPANSGLDLDSFTGELSGIPTQNTVMALQPLLLVIGALSQNKNEGRKTDLVRTFALQMRGNSAPLVTGVLPIVQATLNSPLFFSTKEYFRDPDGDKLQFFLLASPTGAQEGRGTGYLEGQSHAEALPYGSGVRLDPRSGVLSGIPTSVAVENSPLQMILRAQDEKGRGVQTVLILIVAPDQTLLPTLASNPSGFSHSPSQIQTNSPSTAPSNSPTQPSSATYTGNTYVVLVEKDKVVFLMPLGQLPSLPLGDTVGERCWLEHSVEHETEPYTLTGTGLRLDQRSGVLSGIPSDSLLIRVCHNKHGLELHISCLLVEGVTSTENGSGTASAMVTFACGSESP